MGDLLSLLRSGSKSPLFPARPRDADKEIFCQYGDYSCHDFEPEWNGKQAVLGSCYEERPTKRHEKPARKNQGSRGYALRSRKCALLYRCSTCIFARSARLPVRPHPNAADRPEQKMLSVWSPASSAPSKGYGPCAASRLSQVDGRSPPCGGR